MLQGHIRCEVSFFEVSFFIVVSGAGFGETTLAVSFTVAVSLPVALLPELQPDISMAVVAITKPKLKICFFIGVIYY